MNLELKLKKALGESGWVGRPEKPKAKDGGVFAFGTSRWRPREAVDGRLLRRDSCGRAVSGRAAADRRHRRTLGLATSFSRRKPQSL
jgi:hypothetical protein